MKQKKKFCTLITPFFNEEKEITRALIFIIKYRKKSDFIKKYIFIDDGSTDKSFSILKNILDKNKNIKKNSLIIRNLNNLGWANSLKLAIKNVSTDYFISIGGDGEVNINKFLKRPTADYDFVIYNRRNMIKTRPFHRVMISKLFRYLVYFLFGTNFLDVNSPCLFNKNKLKKMKLVSNSFFLQAEIIFKLIKKKAIYTTGKVDLIFKNDKNKSSSLNFKMFFKVLIDILKLKFQ